MAPRQPKASKPARREPADWLFPNLATSSEVDVESSLLDVVDNVLNKGMVLNGDVLLGVANVDLIYLKLSVLLAAIDKLTDGPLFTAMAAPARKTKKRSRRK
jgi:hypothetical protein